MIRSLFSAIANTLARRLAVRWMRMLQEYDFVLLKQTSAVPLPQGTKGAVMIVHPANPLAYEVEFMSDKGDSLGTFTVRAVDLEFVAPP